ncbi:glycosyltransferase family 1 protein [Larkinella humicola]|uniref:Glycosyltransferase family 1 protein n=2 Tax=Larkinella humicola TaxID=2607654 RepID=A0A5N1JKE3_9BACT|nr:glycosyltransferase family 1 protein [Larkinella humicola]
MGMTALFFMVPAYGHLNLTFKLARQLQSDGYQIVYGYLGKPELAQQIHRQGFAVHWLQSLPFGIGVEEATHKEKSESYLESLLDRFTDKTFRARSADLQRTVEALKPALIFVDSYYSTDFIVLYPFIKDKGIEVILLQTMLSTYEDAATPPLNSQRIPGQDSVGAIRRAWRTYYRNRAFKQLGQTLLYLGRSNHRIIRQKFRQNGLPDDHRIRRDKTFYTGFDNLPEWILYPRAFEFPQRTLHPFQQHLGLMIDAERVENPSSSYQTMLKQLSQERQTNPEVKVMYASLGTVSNAHAKPRLLKGFYQRLIAAAARQPNWRLILSVGPELKAVLPDRIPNGWIFERVPQVDMLRHCDAFVTHGGPNSVLEGVLCGVPMLAYPLNDTWDQNGYTARLAYFGCGLTGNLRKDRPGDMEQKMIQLLTEPKFRQKLLAFREQLQDFDGSTALFALFGEKKS